MQLNYAINHAIKLHRNPIFTWLRNGGNYAEIHQNYAMGSLLMPGSHFQVIQLLAIVKNVKTFKIRRDGPVCCRLRIPARPGAWPSDALQVQTRVTRASGARQKPSRWSRRLRVCLVVETEGLDLEGPLRGRNGCSSTFLRTPLSDPYPHADLVQWH